MGKFVRYNNRDVLKHVICGLHEMMTAFFLVVIIASCEPTEEPPLSQQNLLTDLSKEELKKGSHLYKLQCARCHGMEGKGGTGPSLRRQSLSAAKDDASLMAVIRNGIPGTEMPGTWLLTPPDIRLVGGYVRTLGRIEDSEPIQGNAANGQLIYETKGACVTCHNLNQERGGLGPDLTNIGAKRSMDFIRQSLLEPGFYKKEEGMSNTSSGFITNLIFEVVTKDNQKVTGTRVNEDTFTLQLRDNQNRLHSFRKGDLLAMKKLFGKSFMPSVKEVLTATETDDIIAYLVSLKKTDDE